jgi:hypothetical protein
MRTAVSSGRIALVDQPQADQRQRRFVVGDRGAVVQHHRGEPAVAITAGPRPASAEIARTTPST